MFSALGLLPDKSYKPLSDRIPEPLLKESQWLSVPGAYLDDGSMLQTLIPIFAASIFTTSIASLYFGETVAGLEGTSGAIKDLATSDGTVSAALLPIQLTTSALMTYISALLHNQVTVGGDVSAVSDSISSIGAALDNTDQEGLINNVMNTISALLIIRMSKLIGTDRDSIIAGKVQAAATEFPVSLLTMIDLCLCTARAQHNTAHYQH